MAALLCGCASTEYIPYQGAQAQQGTGGAVLNVKGIDIWVDPTTIFRSFIPAIPAFLIFGSINRSDNNTSLLWYALRKFRFGELDISAADLFARNIFQARPEWHYLKVARLVKFN